MQRDTVEGREYFSAFESFKMNKACVLPAFTQMGAD